MIMLDHLMPVPLEERLSQNESTQIWNKKLAFSEGEWIKITAPSGTGKTTFMHILYALRFDYTGNVILNQQNIRNLTADELSAIRKQKLSVIFQDLKLFPHISARENIELKRVLQEPFCSAERMEEMAATLGISAILEQSAGICSYGEQQRIAIVRALMQPFEWLIMDEPFSHLDLANKKIAAALIAAECKKRNAGIIMTDLDDDDLFPYTRKLVL